MYPISRLQVVFEDEAYYAGFIFLLAVSNGYVTSIALMHGPKVVEGHQQLAASFLVAFLG